MKRKQTVFETEWFRVEQEFFDHIEALDGKSYYSIASADGVMILAVTDAEEIILVDQFRPNLQRRTLEFPSGSINEAERPKEAAIRELYEETGFICREVHSLGAGHIMMNRCNSKEFAFLGVGAVQEANFRNQEDINICLTLPDELKGLVLSGRFEQFTALGLLVLAGWRLGRWFTEQR